MWKNHEAMLLMYGLIICNEWKRRGYKDIMAKRFENAFCLQGDCHIGNFISPKWLGNKEFHKSHKSNLLRKDKEFYSKYNWNVPDNLPYVWITGGKNET